MMRAQVLKEVAEPGIKSFFSINDVLTMVFYFDVDI